MREEDDQLYIYKLYGISTPRRLRAQKQLRQKIGRDVKISDIQIAKAQEIIDNPRSDFAPYAMENIKEIENAIVEAGDISYLPENIMGKILTPLIQIKGQAAMFGNELASDLSKAMAGFLEHYKRIDKDILKILSLYCQSIRASYGRRIYDIDNPKGQALLLEINYAIERYNKKFKKMTGR